MKKKIINSASAPDLAERCIDSRGNVFTKPSSKTMGFLIAACKPARSESRYSRRGFKAMLWNLSKYTDYLVRRIESEEGENIVSSLQEKRCGI